MDVGFAFWFGFLMAFGMCVAFGLSECSIDTAVTSGKTFKIEDATYRCEKTNELKVNE